MSVDPKLVAATTLRTAHGMAAHERPEHEVVHQLQLAHVLLDGEYQGVATLAEVLSEGNFGLGTVDHLDGEMVIVDGEPWQIDWHGRAHLLPLSTRTPFAVVASMHPVRRIEIEDAGWEEVATTIEQLIDDPSAVVLVRLEGIFTSALMRSVPPQTPPYRPFNEVASHDEVRWTVAPFAGVLVGFRFPDLTPGATIAGLHLHGLDDQRTTGGHVHDFHVDNAVLTLGVSHDVTAHLPTHSKRDLLQTPHDMRVVLQALSPSEPKTTIEVAQAIAETPENTRARLDWLADRGFVEAQTAHTDAPTWQSLVTDR